MYTSTCIHTNHDQWKVLVYSPSLMLSDHCLNLYFSTSSQCNQPGVNLLGSSRFCGGDVSVGFE